MKASDNHMVHHESADFTYTVLNAHIGVLIFIRWRLLHAHCTFIYWLSIAIVHYCIMNTADPASCEYHLCTQSQYNPTYCTPLHALLHPHTPTPSHLYLIEGGVRKHSLSHYRCVSWARYNKACLYVGKILCCLVDNLIHCAIGTLITTVNGNGRACSVCVCASEYKREVIELKYSTFKWFLPYTQCTKAEISHQDIQPHFDIFGKKCHINGK